MEPYRLRACRWSCTGSAASTPGDCFGPLADRNSRRRGALGRLCAYRSSGDYARLRLDRGSAQCLEQRSPIDQALEPTARAEHRDEVTRCPRDRPHSSIGRPRAVVEHIAVRLDGIAKQSVGEVGGRDPGRVLPGINLTGSIGNLTGSIGKLEPAGFRVRSAHGLDPLDVLQELLRKVQWVRWK